MEDRNCSNCGNRCELEQWFYRLREQGKEKWKVKQMGYACLAFADEGHVIHMVDYDEKEGMCEMWEPRWPKNEKIVY